MATKLVRNDPVVFHFRFGTGTATNPKAGATVVFSPEARKFGIALCCQKDRYVRQIGIRIATQRAISESKPNSRRRFDHSIPYSGELELEPVRIQAKIIVKEAAARVNNDIWRNV